MTKTSVPASYPRRILLAVTGMSPQVLTETLYALAHDAHHTPPTEVHIITTRLGAQRARTALLHEDGGQFRALLRDYPALGQPRFDEQHIHVIHSADGTPLDDIRTPDENAAAADAITALLGELTRDAGSALHVSIAGGRKTMGFYLGYAFSLFARPQDCLSHVLVSEPFENHPDFFFPPLTPRRLATRDGHHIDTADAHITLAEIPVVPLRHGLPQQLLDRAHSYIDTVTAAQSRLGAPRLHIDFEQKQITCGAHTKRSSIRVCLRGWHGGHCVRPRAWPLRTGGTSTRRSSCKSMACTSATPCKPMTKPASSRPTVSRRITSSATIPT